MNLNLFYKTSYILKDIFNDVKLVTNSDKKKIYDMIGKKRKILIPTPKQINNEALNELDSVQYAPSKNKGRHPQDILENFNYYLAHVEKELEVRFDQQYIDYKKKNFIFNSKEKEK